MFVKNVSTKRESLVKASKAKWLKASAEKVLGAHTLDKLMHKKAQVAERILNTNVVVWLVDGIPCFLGSSEDDPVVFPTMNLLKELWPLQNMLCVYIPSLAMKNILNGADVMSKGVLNLKELSGSNVGDPVLVLVSGHPYPIAVGRVSKELFEFHGLQGRAVDVIHHAKDTLSLSLPLSMSVLVIADKKENMQSDSDLEEDEEMKEEEDVIEILPDPLTMSKMEYSEGIEQLVIDRLGLSDADYVEIGSLLSGVCLEPSSHHSEEHLVKSLVRKKICKSSKLKGLLMVSLVQEKNREMEETLVEDLDYALAISLAQDVKDVDLPVPASLILSQHMKKHVPSLSLKHSPFKKLSNFLDHWVKEGLLSVKSHRGELMVSFVNREHPKIASFLLPEPNSSKIVPANSNKTLKKELCQTYKIFIKYRPMKTSRFVFADDHLLVTTQEAKGAFLKYIRDNQRDDGQFVLIEGDEHLRSLIPTGQRAKKGDVLKAFMKEMKEHYAIFFEGDIEEPKFRRGPVPKIGLDTKMRQGRKIITLVKGLEPFRINPDTLSSFCQKQFACSCSTKSLPPGYDLLIQGNVVNDLKNVLIQAFGVSSSIISITEKVRK